MKEDDLITRIKDHIMLWQWRFVSIQGFIAPLFYISTISLILLIALFFLYLYREKSRTNKVVQLKNDLLERRNKDITSREL